ncbi:hypothetical protein HPB50_004717 [Hyalomma asiaticum]|uniref:Uncharacterized protein n=1 Tax=Hyalomma asiaticum TaxID=266040 RepID=A0ACB7SRV5_HYAAI|nr:hypothetical protein HPB50_004717 [Hyalomma asiaticum]
MSGKESKERWEAAAQCQLLPALQEFERRKRGGWGTEATFLAGSPPFPSLLASCVRTPAGQKELALGCSLPPLLTLFPRHATVPPRHFPYPNFQPSKFVTAADARKWLFHKLLAITARPLTTAAKRAVHMASSARRSLRRPCRAPAQLLYSSCSAEECVVPVC